MIGVLSWIGAKLIKWGFGSVVDRSLSFLENSQDQKTQQTAEAFRAYVAIEAEAHKTQRLKMSHWPYWVMVSIFVVPLGMWWAAILIDSTFHFSWAIADIPQPYLQQWAGDMIKWLFYLGTGTAAVKTILR